jgi:hypothetical protein
MIPHIVWARSDFGEPPSPFLHGKTERPLKITFHTSSFASATAEEAEAIEALRQLSNLPEIEALDTAPGTLPHLEIDSFENGDTLIPIKVTSQNRTIRSGIPFPNQWPQIAARLAGQADPLHSETMATLVDLVIAQAHCQLRYDILITLSPRLLAHREKAFVREANPRAPSEAAQIVGLFLRTRDNYTWQAHQNARSAFDRGLFYWVLIRHRLPNLWRYFSACVHAEAARRDDILHLGQSILVRCARSIEARDAIGAQFFIPQGNNARDTIMYHFDYLTLLLAGAFDAQARVAHRAYRIDRPNERRASFRWPDFRDALRDKGANGLHNITSGQYYQDLMTLIHELRNTIHGAGLPSLAYQAGTQPEESFVTVLPEYSDRLWQAAERCGSSEKWGLIRMHEVLLEPYTYAANLVNECFHQIDAIAAETNVTGLFPDGYDIPPLQDGPPDDDVFGERIRKRLAVLG